MMNITRFILLQFVILLMIGGLFYLHKDQVAMVKLPPPSLAEWYKPENKRQVWLHTMFKLRRQIQAVESYLDSGDSAHLGSRLDELENSYKKIGDMVPEWKSKTDLSLIQNIKESVNSGSRERAVEAMAALRDNCDSCHLEYQAVTALLYRSPNFRGTQVSRKGDSTVAYDEHMRLLQKKVNEIKIGLEDGQIDHVKPTLGSLRREIVALGSTCDTCHQFDVKTYPGTKIESALDALERSLVQADQKQAGKNLGGLAVLACAQCHASHKLLYDASRIFSERPGFIELLKH